MKIAHLTDLHFQGIRETFFLQEKDKFEPALEREIYSVINQLNPEYIAITGDFVDGINEDIEELKFFVSSLKGEEYGTFTKSKPAKVVGCLGNHDYPIKYKLLEECPWIKVNSGFYNKVHNVCLYSFDDAQKGEGNKGINEICLFKVLDTYPDAAFIFLAHNPATLLALDKLLKGKHYDPDRFLGLAGHTHGMECFLPALKINRLAKKILSPLFPWMNEAEDPYYIRGTHQLDHLTMHVNVGIGSHRTRIFCKSEIAVFEIS